LSNIILFGFKGCGKTYFGKQLAEKLQMPFIDTDDLIENAASLSCREIYQRKGANFFRKLEKKIVFSLKETTHSIISIGGGTVLNKKNVAFLQKIGTLIYLKIDKETLKRRIFEKELPAYLEGKNPDQLFEKLHSTRKRVYESIPAYVVDTEGKQKQQTLWEIIHLVRSLQ
jgi:shikimate kinase